MTERFRLSRAGVLNVWQYDEQVFEFAGGRLLLRGSNGAGKSKTLEMLRGSPRWRRTPGPSRRRARCWARSGPRSRWS